MTDREIMQMALDALIDAADSQSWEMQQNIDQHGEWYRRSVYLKEAVAKSQETIKVLRAALAQPKQEPVAWCFKESTGNLFGFTTELFDDEEQASNLVPLYTAPPQREWVGLTDEEKLTIVRETDNPVDALAATEAKLKEKNHE